MSGKAVGYISAEFLVTFYKRSEPCKTHWDAAIKMCTDNIVRFRLPDYKLDESDLANKCRENAGDENSGASR